MTIELPADVRARLDAHLDAVEEVLTTSGRPREQRRGIVEDLEAQLLDMVGKQSAAPTLADIEMVLTKVDPPGAYADANVSKADRAAIPAALLPGKAPYCRLAITGFFCILASFLLVPLLLLPMLFSSGPFRPMSTSGISTMPVDRAVALSPRSLTSEPPVVAPTVPPVIAQSNDRVFHGKSVDATPCLLALISPFGLTGTIMGWIAVSQIRKSKGTLRGMSLALFDGLFFPIFFILIIAADLLMK